MTAVPYTYRALVFDVHDGDTFTAALDLGFGLSFKTAVRLVGCNARELSMPGGQEARANLVAKFGSVGWHIMLTSMAWDKFGGRVDAAVTLPDGSDLATGLIVDGWAAAWNGTGAKPVPPWPRTV